MNVFKKNLSWIFFGNIVHAVFQFALNILCARWFGSEDYGLINYSASLIAFFTAVGTLGFNGVITKYFAQNEKDAGKYLGTAIITRIAFALLSIVLLQIIAFYDKASDARLQIIIFCQSLQILFGAGDLFIYWYRYKGQAKVEAVNRLIAFFIAAAWRIVAILFCHNLVWYVLGVSFETCFFIIFLYRFYKKEYVHFNLAYCKSILREMLKTSYPFILSAVLVTIYGQTDKIMLKSMINISSVGLYSVSLTLAGAISIIPSALIEGFRPDIMVFKIQNPKTYRRRLQQLYGLIFWLCIAYCVVITVLAKPLISMLYGPEYMAAVSSLSIITWYTSFSYFGGVNSMYMVAEDKTTWVQAFTLIGAFSNILLNLVLIPRYGIEGAAVASLLTQIIANYLLLYLIKPVRDCFVIMNEGIILKGFR